jgi:hypothetical protein
MQSDAATYLFPVRRRGTFRNVARQDWRNNSWKQCGLPHDAMPGIKLESGRSWPASGLAGAQRRPWQTLAARSSRVPAGDSRARNAA